MTDTGGKVVNKKKRKLVNSFPPRNPTWTVEESCALLDACLANLKAQCSSIIPGTPVIWGGLLKKIQWPPGATPRHEPACKARVHMLKKSFLRGKLTDEPQLHTRMVQFSFYWRSARSIIMPGMSEMHFDKVKEASNDSHSTVEPYTAEPPESVELEPTLDLLLPEQEDVHEPITLHTNEVPLVFHPPEEVVAGKIISTNKLLIPPKGRGFANIPGRASYVIQLLFAWKEYELSQESSTGELPNPLEYRHWRTLTPTIRWNPPLPFYVRPERCQQEYKFTRTSWVHGYGLSTVLKRAIVDYSLFPPLKEIQLRMPTTKRNHNKPFVRPTSPVIPTELETILRDRTPAQLDKPPPPVVRPKPRFLPEEVKGSTETPILKRLYTAVNDDQIDKSPPYKHQLDLSLLRIHQSQEEAARHYSLIQRLKTMVDTVIAIDN